VCSFFLPEPPHDEASLESDEAPVAAAVDAPAFPVRTQQAERA
jgi:hypothetical protein